METNYQSQEPPSRSQLKARNISVAVIKDPNTGEPRLRLDPPTVDLTINEQAAWRCNDGRLEIRFAPNNTPFLVSSYKAANGGTILSGAPARTKISATPYPYTLLVTTTDGFFIKQDADLRTVASDGSTGPRPPSGGQPGKGCLTLLGFGLLYSLLSKLRALS